MWILTFSFLQEKSTFLLFIFEAIFNEAIYTFFQQKHVFLSENSIVLSGVFVDLNILIIASDSGLRVNNFNFDVKNSHVLVKSNQHFLKSLFVI